jgi:adenylate kinase
VYLFVGPPGSGKGTLSNLLVRQYGCEQLSTGNLCRKHIAEQTEIGKQIDFAIKSGKLVSDSLINVMVEEWFKETIERAANIILDGYPRTVNQAASFDEFLKMLDAPVDLYVIRFCISDDAVVERVAGRLMCQNKECQKVYSTLGNSALAPKKAMVCDNCGSPLGRRNDDAGALITERLRAYHKHEQDLLKFYTQQGYRVYEIFVEAPFDTVVAEFNRQVGLRSI